MAGRWLTLFLLAVTNLCLIFAIAGGLTPLADILAPLTGHMIGVGLAASLAALMRRWAAEILVGGVALTVALHAWLGIAGCCRPSAPVLGPALAHVPASETRSGLRLVALNTWHRNSDLGRLERYLATVDADVIVLSEFGTNKRALLASLKHIYPYQVDCADWTCSLVLLSRVPFEASGAARFGPDRQSGSPTFVWARLAGSVTVVGAHLYRPSRNPWRHKLQMASLIEFVRHIEGPLVLAGDLNTSPWSYSYRSLRASSGLTPVARLRPTWPAWPVVMPQVAFDHIFVSSELAILGSGTGPAVGSDHLPVWAELQRRSLLRDRAAPATRRLASGLAATRPHLGDEFLADLGGEHCGAGHLRR